MKSALWACGFLFEVALSVGLAATSGLPPHGKVPILRSSELQPGMKGEAWTVFQGSEPEPVPVEIIGLLKNALGPRQDLILAKLGGKAAETNVAGGMSGSPVYVDGKLVGAISRRVSVFSPETICGITPIEQMMEVIDLHEQQVANRGPYQAESQTRSQWGERAPSGGVDVLGQAVTLVPIDTPLVFSGFREEVLREIAGLFRPLGVTVVQGGGGSTSYDPKPVQGWEKALRPGQGVAALLVTGDMTVSVQGTVTYNDGRRVLAFGHSFLNLGPVELPMSRSEVVMTLSSSYQPNKFANPKEIVGTIREDRTAGALGILGQEARMMPVTVTVRSLDDTGQPVREKHFRYSVFVHERYTPTLMIATLYNTLSGVNEFSEQTTYRLTGKVALADGQTLSLTTMQTPAGSGTPAPLLVANYVGDRLTRLFSSSGGPPRFTSAEVTVDLLPEARLNTIENAWLDVTEARPGDKVTATVFLRAYRGARTLHRMELSLPPSLPPGQHRILFSDAETLNRLQAPARAGGRLLGLQETVSLINQERSNNRLYVSLVVSAPSLFYEDKHMPNVPLSALNVMQAVPSGSRGLVTSRETVFELMSFPFDTVVSGNFSLTITVK